MTLAEISDFRLENQNVSSGRFSTPAEIVAWMGAMQAQDFAMSKWALGIRLPGSTEKTINDAFNNGSVLRTHVLRPTWHLVTAENIRWMVGLTAPGIKASMRSRHRELDLDDKILTQYYKIIQRVLERGAHLTREELIGQLELTKTGLDNNRAYHILLCAELDGIICSGAMNGGKFTYALLDERAPAKNVIDREEAMVRLGRMYFQSHGPATTSDYAWWSGLPVRDVKTSLELLKDKIENIEIDSVKYYFSGTLKTTKHDDVHLLPAFDEIIISYSDRTAVLALTHNRKAVSNNGVFRPVVMLGGQVAGIWKRTIKKDRVIVEIALFDSLGKAMREPIEKAAEIFGSFIGRRAEVKFS